eukprot:GEMP01037591.1.p1 GENE.GEMP01037591.1~~GEMP01037591.1.p1  ORF type:complete len:608 (+),score=119.32 GEMP01037591.1:120-1943(+)
MSPSVKDLHEREVTNVSPLFLRLDMGSPLRSRLERLAPHPHSIGRHAPAEATAVSRGYVPSQIIPSPYMAPPKSGAYKPPLCPDDTRVATEPEKDRNCDYEGWPKVLPSSPGFRCDGGYRSMTNDSKIKKINEDLDERLNYYVQKVPLSTRRMAPASPGMRRATEAQLKHEPQTLPPPTMELIERLKLWYKDSATVLKSKDKEDTQKDAVLSLANEELKRVRGRLETVLFENTSLKQNIINKAEAEVYHHICSRADATCSALQTNPFLPCSPASPGEVIRTQRCPHCGHEFPQTKKRMIRVLDNDQVIEIPRGQVGKAPLRRCLCPHCGSHFPLPQSVQRAPNQPRVDSRDSEVPLAKSPRAASKTLTLPMGAFDPRQEFYANDMGTSPYQGRVSPQARHVATSPMSSHRATSPRTRHTATSPILPYRETSPRARHMATSPMLPYRETSPQREAAMNVARRGTKQQRHSFTSWSTNESARSSNYRSQRTRTQRRRSLQQSKSSPKNRPQPKEYARTVAKSPRGADYGRSVEYRRSDTMPAEGTKYTQSPRARQLPAEANDAPSSKVLGKAAMVTELLGQVHVEAKAYQDNIAHLADLLETYEGVRTY